MIMEVFSDIHVNCDPSFSTKSQTKKFNNWIRKSVFLVYFLFKIHILQAHATSSSYLFFIYQHMSQYKILINPQAAFLKHITLYTKNNSLSNSKIDYKYSISSSHGRQKEEIRCILPQLIKKLSNKVNKYLARVNNFNQF